jgi:hypothetical protein
VVDGTHVDLQGSAFSSQIGGSFDWIFYRPATALISWSGANTIYDVTNDGGRVRVTLAPQGVIANNWPVCIFGVRMAGSTQVDGCWIVQNASGTSFDLGPSSSFSPGDSYVTGGDAKTWGAPGGGIAAASSTNWTMYGSDRTFPMCTDDGGASYTEVDAPGGLYAQTTVTGGPYNAGSSSFTVADGTQVSGYQIYIPLASGRLITNTGYTVNGNTVTLNSQLIPPGDSIQAGAPISSETGWPDASYFLVESIAADKVTPNTFYGVNTTRGLLKWTHCNAPVLVTPTTNNGLPFQWDFHGKLKAVPGQAGHLFYASGAEGGAGGHPASTRLWRTCNGVNTGTNTVTWSEVPGFFEPQSVGFGHTAPVHNYSAIIVVGWYSPTDNINDAQYGVWRSTDDGSNGSTTTCTGGTWQNLTASGGPFLSGWQQSVPALDIEGDPFIYGPVYLAGQDGAWTGDFQ